MPRRARTTIEQADVPEPAEEPTFFIEGTIRVRGTIPLEEMPNTFARRVDHIWRKLAQEIIDSSSRGRVLVMEIPTDKKWESIRTSISQELKVLNYKLTSRSMFNAADNTRTLYLYAEPRNEAGSSA